MNVQIRAAVSPGEIRVAAVAGETLLDFALWRPGRPDGVEDLHRGRVAAVAPSLAGCFVRLADGDGFLPDSEGGKGLSEGGAVTVRVTRAAQAGKGVRLSARGLEQTEGDAPVLLARGPGALRELAAFYPDAPILIDDAATLARLRSEWGGRLRLVPQAFDDALESEVAALFESSVKLSGGAMIHIEPTRALVAIDLDSGLGGGREARANAHFAANRALLPELVRQIRLRDLAGTILVDFAGLPARKRASLGPELTALLASDPRAPRLAGFTPMGLAEIVRTRRHPPLHELSQGPHATGLRALCEAARLPQRPWRLRALPAIIEALERDPVALAAFAHGAVYGVQLQADPGLSAPFYLIEEA